MFGHHHSSERPAGQWRHPGWSWAVGRDWVLPAGVSAATLLLGAALAGLPVVVAGDFHDPQVRAQSLAFALLGVAGLVALAATAIIRRGRNALLSGNGTAYVIHETSASWSREDVTEFISAARRHFARTILVPGPGDLGGSWDWPLREGAEQWDARVDELARAFRAMNSDDNHATPNGLFIWAWWAVAFAVCARLTAADRSLVLSVWQRPTRGRAGHLTPAPWSQRPHRFGHDEQAPGLASVLPGAVADEFVWPAQLTVVAPHSRRRARVTPTAPLVVLLIRLGRQSWGPIPGDRAQPDPASRVNVVAHDAAGLSRSVTIVTEIHEFRVVPSAGAAAFPWAAFPSLVAAASAWVRRKATDLGDRTLLLGTSMPAETAAGLGIDAAQLNRPGWPLHLWPIVYDSDHEAFAVPRLDLGSARHAG